MSVVFIFFEKIYFFECQTKNKKNGDVLFRIKGVVKKIHSVENDQKRKKSFFRKMLAWIKDDRDSVT